MILECVCVWMGGWVREGGGGSQQLYGSDCCKVWSAMGKGEGGGFVCACVCTCR